MGKVHETVRLIPAVRSAEMIGKTVAKGPIVGAAMGLAAFSLVFGRELTSAVTETETTVEAGSGTVTDIYAMDKVCYAGFDAEMNGVLATYNVEAFGLPTGYSEEITYDGTIQNEVCHDSDKINLHYPEDEEFIRQKECLGAKVCAILDGAYNVTTYEKNPGKGFHSTGNGITRALVKNFITTANVLPLHIKGDGIEGTLRNLAFLTAQDTSSTSCLKEALPLVREAQQESMSQAVTHQINGSAAFYDGQPSLAPDGSDVVIVDRTSVEGLTTQYSEDIEKLQKADNNLSVEDGTVATCTLSKELKQTLAENGDGGEV